MLSNDNTAAFALHTLPISYFRHFRGVKARVALYSRIAQIAVHAVYFREIGAAALGAHVHFELLMTAVVAVCEREINALIEALLHSAAHKALYSAHVVVNGIADILYLTAVEQVPETFLLVLLLDRRDVLADAAVK